MNVTLHHCILVWVIIYFAILIFVVADHGLHINDNKTSFSNPFIFKFILYFKTDSNCNSEKVNQW